MATTAPVDRLAQTILVALTVQLIDEMFWFDDVTDIIYIKKMKKFHLNKSFLFVFLLCTFDRTKKTLRMVVKTHGNSARSSSSSSSLLFYFLLSTEKNVDDIEYLLLFAMIRGRKNMLTSTHTHAHMNPRSMNLASYLSVHTFP